MPRIGDHKQLWSGLFFALLGVGTLSYLPPEIGTAAAMGPGYFPMLLGIGLIVLGAAATITGILSRTGTRAEAIPVPTLVAVIAGIWAFGALINTGGLVVALLCLVMLSCFDRITKRPLEIGAIYAIMLGMTWFIFIHVIQLPIKLFWWS